MHQINLIDETFDKNQAHHYNFVIQYGLNGLSFCLLDTVKNKYVAFRYYPESQYNASNINQLLTSDEIFSHTYKETLLLYNGGQSTLVPIPYFDETKVPELYHFNFGKQDNAEYHFDRLPETLAVNIYVYPTETLKIFKEKIPALKVFHRTTPLIENLVQDSARWPRSKCFVSVHKGILDIGLAHLRKLDFFNSFMYREKTDIVYYILNTLEQFNLSPALTDVYLSVDIDKHEEIYEYLNGFLTHVKFIRPSEKFTFSYMFDDYVLTRFVNLFNLPSCVL